MNRKEITQDDWLQDFKASLKRPLQQRWEYSFIHTFKPVMDAKPYRSFSSMAQYRQWCQKELPSWLGYGQNL